MITIKLRKKIRMHLRRQGIKVYRSKRVAILKARLAKFYTGSSTWVEKQPAGYLVWNKHIQKVANKSLMAKGEQKIRERDIKKTIIFKTK